MGLLAAALFFAAALPPAELSMSTAQAAPAAPATEVIAARGDGHERMTVPVRIGGQGPFRFLLDTGAQTTVLSHDLARSLSLPAGQDVILIGVAGRQQAQTVQLGEIGLGRRSARGLTVPVLQAEDIGADGILGLDTLKDQRVLIDFARNVVAVNDAKALGGDTGFEIVVTARRKAGQLILTNARVDGVKVSVIVDTGADASIGNRALQRALGRRAPLALTRLTSVTGQVLPADIGYARTLQLQGLDMANVLLAFADAPPFAHLGLADKPALLLGMHEMRMFRRVAIDFPTRRILFDLPKRGDPPPNW